jgi:class 3 adenylate cyclase/Flp pilus assembly protein TadD
MQRGADPWQAAGYLGMSLEVLLNTYGHHHPDYLSDAVEKIAMREPMPQTPADVAGYSRLMGADEEGVLARLKAARKSLVDPTIAAHRGRIVKTTGDGMLVEFASAVDAARCAIEMQRGLAEQNAAVPEVRRLEYRIGIHVGDIIVDENDIFGDGVNIAARLEGVAEPGGICISDDAQRQIRGKVDTAFEDMGPQNLKNIAEPMRAWRLRMNASGSAAAPIEPPVESAQAPALPDKPSIAVLPFENMSGDPEQEYFADLELDPRFGLVAALAGVCHMRNVLWGFAVDPQFDRKEAVRLLRLALSLDDSDADTLAWAAIISAYMVGDCESSVELVDRAVALNPNSHQAWNSRGWVYRVAGLPEEAVRSLERAMRMSPVDPRLHLTFAGIGLALIELGRFDEAIVAAKKALRQNPSFSPAYRCLASAFAHLGRDAEAREAAARLLEADPAFAISACIARGGQLNAKLLIEGLRKAGLPE